MQRRTDGMPEGKKKGMKKKEMSRWPMNAENAKDNSVRANKVEEVGAVANKVEEVGAVANKVEEVGAVDKAEDEIVKADGLPLYWLIVFLTALGLILSLPLLLLFCCCWRKCCRRKGHSNLSNHSSDQRGEFSGWCSPPLESILVLIDLSPSAMAYSGFFNKQLQALEIWLKFAVEKREPPHKLPVVLQVLLSQIHPIRAFEMLVRIVDPGPWATALSVGIFPVLKLLQCGAFIWANILAIDPVCQHELVKEDGYIYFPQMLNDPLVMPRMKIVSAFVLATIICNNYRPARDKLVARDFVSLCIDLLSSPPISCGILTGLGRLWSEGDEARWHAFRNVVHDKAIEFLGGEVPEIQTAAVHALGCFVHTTSRNNEHATAIENEVCDKLCEKCIYGGSILVCAESPAAIQWFFIDFQSKFAVAIWYTYTPKQNIFGTLSGAYSNVNNHNNNVLLAKAAAVALASDGLVRTEFVDWCGKTWTVNLYDSNTFGLPQIPTQPQQLYQRRQQFYAYQNGTSPLEHVTEVCTPESLGGGVEPGHLAG